jgi:hypothetical protein
VSLKQAFASLTRAEAMQSAEGHGLNKTGNHHTCGLVTGRFASDSSLSILPILLLFSGFI